MPRRHLAAFGLAALLATSSAGAWAQFGFGFGSRPAQPSPTSPAPADDKGVLASLISRALSTPATRVSIGAVEGALSSDAVIRDIEISDRDGVWLKLDRVRLVWRRLALLQRRLEVDQLEIGTLDIARKPIPAEGAVAGENEPLLPELPVKVEIKGFTLSSLNLGEPILGTAAQLTATGRAKLGNDPGEGLDLTFDARRLDRPGTVALRLGLVPQGQRLTLTAKVDEPEGGLIARAGNIPGLPPVSLSLDGQGTLDAFAARLDFAAGPGIGANGTVNVARQGTGRDATLDLQARIEGLLPEAAAPVFAGITRLTGRTTFADDGTITIPGVNLVAAAARLDVAGSLSKDGVADLTVTAANLPNRQDRTAAAGAEIRSLAFKGQVTGPLTAPNLDATLSAAGVSLPLGRLAQLDATLKASAAGLDANGKTQLRIVSDGRASGVALKDPALREAVGDSLTLSLRGLADTAGVLTVDTLTVGTPTVSARFAGRVGSDELKGRANVSAENLRAFSQISKLKLAGIANLQADLEGTPRANRFNAVLTGQLGRFETGLLPVDGLLGRRVGLAGAVRANGTGGYAFDKLSLTGEHATLVIDGSLDQDAADLRLTGSLPDLKRADSRLSGAAALQARVTGGLKAPSVAGEATVTNASALGRPISRLALGFDVKDVTGALNGTVRLDGSVDGKPARGGFRVSRPADGSTALDGLDLTIGSVKAKGSVALDGASLLRGRLSVDAPNLDDLSPLALQKLSGTVRADVALDVVNGGQNARVQADATRVNAFGASLTKGTADLTLTDVYRRPVVAGTVRVDEAEVAGERIGKVRLDAQGTPTASDVTLSASARGFDLDARARVLPGDRTRIEVSSLSARRGKERLALASPATVTLVDGGADLRDVAVALGSGRLTVNGLAGASRLDLRAEARGVPLSVAEIVAPGLGLAGTFEGEARVGGTPSAPTGDYKARIQGLSAPQIRSLNLPRIDVAAAGRLGDGRATLDATVAAGRAGTVRIDGSLPAGGAGALDLAIRGQIDAAAATNGLLASGGRRLTGRLDIDAKVGGTLSAPAASGSATLSGGSFADAGQGIQLGNLRARLVARGQELTLEGGQASTRNGGTVTASGRIRLDPGAGFPGEIRVGGQNAELVRSKIVTAVANLNLLLSGPLARDPRVAGRIDITSAEVSIPQNLPGSLKPLPNTRHKNPTPTTRARLALEESGKKGGAKASPAFDARLDLVLAVPGQITVQGRGLNALLGGQLRLGGTLAKPVANGAFELRKGELQIATTRLDFSRGRISFTGDLTPELDFAANTNAGGAAITVAVSGPANDPNFAFTSSPDLPQDEVLSRLLFNSPSGQLSPFQALALAQAAAQFSGGDGAFENLRRNLGLSGVDVGLSGGGLTGGLQRALGSRVSVGVRAGSTAAQTGIGVDYRITDEIRLRGEVGATGATSGGIAAQYEW